jgi:Fe-S-cluster-containing dehydrogenase component/DMSO reductase anchor subunit
MSTVLELPEHAAAFGDAFEPTGLLAELLRDQQATAVDRFAQWHARETSPLQARHYRDLMPLSPPSAGEQYAFEVDLDACSGCKACVVACHNLNGLEEQETWRSVGLLHGGTTALPVLQHVTASCHHCVEPACLDGCPVEAYEKDPLTGIVRHLDDQCIGCQYCILKCPYDVPRYSRAKGIVRKCDMCSGRLAAGEAPACVQACPNRAIRITIVNMQEVAENAEANLFLPGAPEPGYTLPTTVYKTQRPLPTNLLPADYYAATPQHAHLPLVMMLVLTQMSVGAFVVDQALVVALGEAADVHPATRMLHACTGFVLALVGLSASILHLGRPWLAFRAIIGWRTSWLSREVLAFGAFAALASIYAAVAWLAPWGLPISVAWERLLGGAVAASGLAGVACSTMIYASTRRAFWNPVYTGLKFLLTCLVLGAPIALLVHLAAAWSSAEHVALVMQGTGRWLCLGLMSAMVAKLALEAVVFTWLKARTFTALRRTALLMTGDLARSTFWRFGTGALGGLILPGVLVLSAESTTTPSTYTIVAAVVAMLALSFVGELLERYLFFAAVVAPKMPGAPSA